MCELYKPLQDHNLTQISHKTPCYLHQLEFHTHTSKKEGKRKGDFCMCVNSVNLYRIITLPRALTKLHYLSINLNFTHIKTGRSILHARVNSANKVIT